MRKSWQLMCGISLLFFVGCSDPAEPAQVTANPCGAECPIEQCMFGTCVDDGDAGTPDPVPEDENVDADCVEDADCLESEFCQLGEDGSGGLCEEGCRAQGCPEGQVCDLEERVCVEATGCSGDEDCGELEVCSEEVCVTGCRDDDGCAEGTVCEVAEGEDFGACVEGCRDNGDCPAGTVCNEEKICEGTPCGDDDDCGDFEFCNEGGFCEPGCTSDEECGEGLTCEDNECVGEACDRDTDCPEDQFCGENNFCNFGCRGDDNCFDGEICLANTCVGGCRSDETCDSGLYCEEETSLCEEGCRDDSECALGDSCQRIDVGEGVLRQRCGPRTCFEDGDCDVDLEEGEEQPNHCGDDGLCVEGCRDGNCPEGFDCNLESRQCEETPCQSTDDCAEGQYCNQELEPFSCISGCDDDAQCADDQPCNLDTNTCGCNFNEDCSQNQVCSLGLCIARCGEDADCGDGFFCELETGLCIEGCRDDEFEPNNTESTALPIEAGQFEMRMCNSARIGVDDKDCFTFFLAEGDALTVSLAFSHEDGDLDLTLMDPNQVFLDVSDSLDDTEEVTAVAGFDGEHIFCVEPLGRSFQVGYAMSVVVERDEGCLEDGGEADGDDSCEEVRGTPEVLSLGVERRIEGRTICEDNSDFYAVTMRAGQDLTATMTRTSDGDDFLSLEILNSDCTSIGLPQNLGPERSVTVRAPSDGTFFVRLFGELNDFEGSYDLALLLEGGDSQCPLDTIGEEGDEVIVEPNETPEQSTILNSFGIRRDENLDLTALNVCDGDEDWYRVITDVPSDILAVTLSQSEVEAPLRLEIFDRDGETVLVSTTEDLPSKSVETPALVDAGTYYIRVSPTDDVPQSGIPYTLSVLLRASVQCLPDAFEPNNIPLGAALVSSGTFEATMCREDPNERDYYSMLLGVGDRVSVSLTYDHGVLENMFALLTGPDGELDIRDIAERQGQTDTDAFAEFLVGPNDVGEWIIEVDSSGVGLSLDYTLTVDILSPSCDPDDEEEVDVEEDFDEPNDSCEEATNLEFFTELGGFICGPTQDVDFFEVEVAPNQASLSVRFDYFHFDGNLDLDVFSPDDEIFFSHQVGPNFEEVIVQDPEPGTYCIRVFSTSLLTQNDYRIEATVQSN